MKVNETRIKNVFPQVNFSLIHNNVLLFLLIKNVTILSAAVVSNFHAVASLFYRQAIHLCVSAKKFFVQRRYTGEYKTTFSS